MRAGGRPGYPLDMVEDVFRNPTKHRDILLPFLTTPSDWECPVVFTKQLGRWSAFRAWQYAVRGSQPSRAQHRTLLPEECLRALQDFNEARGDSSLATYTEATRRIVLDPHGLDDRFEPTMDPLKQDELSTWLEYLVFKVCVSDYCRRRVATHQACYDKAWARLASLGVLWPSEVKTQRVEDNTLQTTCRRTEAEVEAELRSAQGVQMRGELATENENGSSEAVATSLIEARAKLQRVRARLTAVDEFFKDTRDHRAHGSYWKMIADVHTKELPWVFQQLPMVRETTRRCTPRNTKMQAPLRRSSRIASQRLARRPAAQVPSHKSIPPSQQPQLAGAGRRKRRAAAGVSAQPLISAAFSGGVRKRRRLG